MTASRPEGAKGDALVLRGIEAAHTWKCACTHAVSSSCAELRADLRAQLQTLRGENERLTQKYKQYSDIWLMRGFPTKDDAPDLDGTVVYLNSQNLLLIQEKAALEARERALVALLTEWHESWQKGLDGDYLDAPTRAALAPRRG